MVIKINLFSMVILRIPLKNCKMFNVVWLLEFYVKSFEYTVMNKLLAVALSKKSTKVFIQLPYTLFSGERLKKLFNYRIFGTIKRSINKWLLTFIFIHKTHRSIRRAKWNKNFVFY